MNKYQEYEARKQEFLKEHPEATPEQIEQFCKKLAKELNI